MVVEDNKINQRLLRDIIRVQGWRSVEADDADMAEEILRMLKVRGEVPDMAMVDIRLPDRSGCDLVRSLKANDNWKVMPVIAVTAMAGRANAQRILEAGCDDYIAKPISVAHIIETVHKYLG
ncbi:MAG: response regulator [Alphaproteobacteria bacterium]|nr:response regulator [Alphaproteobacteria bacterium SS10]